MWVATNKRSSLYMVMPVSIVTLPIWKEFGKAELPTRWWCTSSSSACRILLKDASHPSLPQLRITLCTALPHAGYMLWYIYRSNRSATEIPPASCAVFQNTASTYKATWPVESRRLKTWMETVRLRGNHPLVHVRNPAKNSHHILVKKAPPAW